MEKVIVLNPGKDAVAVADTAGCCSGKPSTASGASSAR